MFFWSMREKNTFTFLDFLHLTLNETSPTVCLALMLFWFGALMVAAAFNFTSIAVISK